MGFTTPKKARNPNAISKAISIISREKIGYFFRNFVGNYVFLYFVSDVIPVVSLDDGFNIALNAIFKKVFYNQLVVSVVSRLKAR